MHSYLDIGTDPILHQYLTDLSVSSQSGPMQSSVTINVHQVHTCRTFTHCIYNSVVGTCIQTCGERHSCLFNSKLKINYQLTVVQKSRSLGSLYQRHQPLISVSMTSLCPISQARNSGVCFITSRESTMAPLSNRSFTVLTWPDREAAWSAA